MGVVKFLHKITWRKMYKNLLKNKSAIQTLTCVGASLGSVDLNEMIPGKRLREQLGEGSNFLK